MLVILSALLIVAVAIVQTALADRLTVMGVKPDLMLLLVIYLGLAARVRVSTVVGFVGGLVEDVFSGGQLGMNAFCLLLIALFVVKMREELVVEHPVTHALLTFVCSLAFVLTYFTLQAIMGFELAWKGIFISRVVLFAVYNSFVSSIIFYLAGSLGWRLPKLLRV